MSFWSLYLFRFTGVWFCVCHFQCQPFSDGLRAATGDLAVAECDAFAALTERQQNLGLNVDSVTQHVGEAICELAIVHVRRRICFV